MSHVFDMILCLAFGTMLGWQLRWVFNSDYKRGYAHGRTIGRMEGIVEICKIAIPKEVSDGKDD